MSPPRPSRVKEAAKRFFGDTKKNHSKKKPLLVALILGVALLVFVVLWTVPRVPEDTSNLETGLEESGLYSKAEVENLIKEKYEQAKGKKEEPDIQETFQEKRQLDSPIAVFIKADEEKIGREESAEQRNGGLQISTGTKVQAYLANAIFSFNVTSPVVAVIDEAVEKDGEVILPKDTQFIGDAGIVKSQDRVNITFTTMVLPDGKEVKIRAMALSLDGSGGIRGKVDKQYDKSLLKAAGETVLAGASLVLGTRSRPLTLEDELRLNTARNLTDDAQTALNNVRIEKSITVEAYTPILVLFLESV